MGVYHLSNMRMNSYFLILSFFLKDLTSETLHPQAAALETASSTDETGGLVRSPTPAGRQVQALVPQLPNWMALGSDEPCCASASPSVKRVH